MNSNFRWLQFFVFLMVSVSSVFGSAQSSQTAQAEIVPQEIVECYAVQYPQYPRKFVEAGCLNIIRGYGVEFLEKQSALDFACFSQNKKCKSDVFVNIGKCCQKLDGIYVNHPFFKNRYTAEQSRTGLEEWLSDEVVIVTPVRLLDACEIDSKVLTVDYDKQELATKRGSRILLWRYRSCESARLGNSIMNAVKTPIHADRIKQSLQKPLSLPLLLDLSLRLKKYHNGQFYPVLYGMAVEVAGQQIGRPVSELKSVKDIEMGIGKIDAFYTLLMDSFRLECLSDTRYKEFAENYLLNLVSKRVFAQATCGFGSIGRDATSTFLRYYLNAYYEQSLVQKFDDTVCRPMVQDHDQALKELYGCFSQDARATLLFSQQAREIVQLQTVKQKEFFDGMRRLLLDTAHNLKQTACDHETQSILVQREKLKADSQEWVVAAQQLEKSREGVEFGVQAGIDTIQLARQGLHDVDGVGVEYLVKKNNGSLQKSRMKTWIEFVGLQRLVKQQRAKLQVDSAAWKTAVEHVENQRLAYEQRLDDGLALVDQAHNVMRKYRSEKLIFVAGQLEQKNHDLQEQREHDGLRAIFAGWCQGIKKNSMTQSVVSPDTMSNSSGEQAALSTGSVQQGSSVAETDHVVVVAQPVGVVELPTRRNNPYASKVTSVSLVEQPFGVEGSRQIVSLAMPFQEVLPPSYGQTVGNPPAYDDAHYFVDRSNGLFCRSRKVITPNGIHIYR